MRVLYMGTPDFAVPPLKAVIEAGYDVCAVISQPDRPKGRGMKMTQPPVKVVALENNIPVYQPESLKDQALMPILEEYKPDVIAVVAYGKILPEYILKYPKFGCINVHGSLLPKYRGAAPIQWAVINGEEKTGVCTMFMDKGLDTGDVLLTKVTDISAEDTAESLFDRLAPMGAEALIDTLKQLEGGNAKRIPQDDALSSLAPPLSKENARINWTGKASEIDCLIRGCYSWPIAYTMCEDMRIKIIKAKIGGTCTAVPGSVISVDSEGMAVATGDGICVIISEFQPEGSKRMTPDAYFRGHPTMIGKVLK